MRALYSYGIALVILIGLALWLGTGLLVVGGKGAGNGETPVAALIDEPGGPISEAAAAVDGALGRTGEAHAAEIDPHKSIAERNESAGTGESAAPRSVRVAVITAKFMPIEVPLRGRTKAKAVVSVVAQTNGIVQAVSVNKGERVKAGDVLCTLDQGARKLAVEQARAAVEQARTTQNSNSELVKKGIAAPNTKLGNESALKAAEAQLENAELELGRTVIKTDIPGLVQAPLADVGATLAPGAPCATVVQLDPMMFVASVPEARIANARLGLQAEITTITGDKARGAVSYIAATANDATRSFPIEIDLPNADFKLRDGITADAVVNVGTAPVHVLPQSALTLDDNGVLGIRTVEKGNVVAFHPVTIIRDTRDGVWVVNLPTSINLITLGQEFVQPGQIVDAKTAAGEPIA